MFTVHRHLQSFYKYNAELYIYISKDLPLNPTQIIYAAHGLNHSFTPTVSMQNKLVGCENKEADH